MKSSRDQVFDDPHASRQKPRDLHVLSRDEAYRIAQRLPQAVFKVLSYAYDAKSVGSTLAYISRDGDLELEDQDGNLLYEDAVKERLDEWSLDFDTRRKRSRESMHMVLSSPVGSDPAALKQAVRSFADQTFGLNHDYLFVAHNDTENPHVHICVKTSGHDGTKLNPRKDDLRLWRGAYAEHLRAVGIEVEASPRLARGQGKKSYKSAIHQLLRQGTLPRVMKAAIEESHGHHREGTNLSDMPWAIAARATTARYREQMFTIARELFAESKDKGASELDQMAATIQQFAEHIPVPRTFAEELVADYDATMRVEERNRQREARLNRQTATPESARQEQGKDDEGVELDIDID